MKKRKGYIFVSRLKVVYSNAIGVIPFSKSVKRVIFFCSLKELDFCLYKFLEYAIKLDNEDRVF